MGWNLSIDAPIDLHWTALLRLIPVFGILGRLAKFFVMEYADFVGMKFKFRHLGGQSVDLRS
jgi:hypothetical protein